MQAGVGLLVTDMMPIFMIMALDVVIIIHFSINCSTVICLLTVCVLSLEAFSENNGPRVYYHHIIFRSIKPKTQTYLVAIYLPLPSFALLFIFYTYHYKILSLQVIKGIDNPFIALGASICLFV